MIIRNYIERDFKEVKKLYMDGRKRELETANLKNVIDFEKDKVKFEKFQKGKNLVIDLNGEICGFICLNAPEVSLFYIAENHTKKGLGKKLLLKGIEELKKENKKEKICLDLFKDNEKAKALYTKVGFETVADFKRVIDNEEKTVIHMELK